MTSKKGARGLDNGNPLDVRIKINKVFNETFDLAFRLLATVYIRERPGDKLPYQATETAKKVFDNPSGVVESELNDLMHQVWRRWYQVNTFGNEINLQALSNLLMHEIWFLLMAVQELNLGNLVVAEAFAGKAELTMREIEAECFSVAGN